MRRRGTMRSLKWAAGSGIIGTARCGMASGAISIAGASPRATRRGSRRQPGGGGVSSGVSSSRGSQRAAQIRRGWSAP